MAIVKRGHCSIDTKGMTIEEVLKMIEAHIENIRDFIKEGNTELIPSAIEQIQCSADALERVQEGS